MSLVAWVCVALGAAVGGGCRYGLTQVLRSRMPALGDAPGTTVVNVAGAFLLGLLGHLMARGSLAPTPYALLGTGFCGALTTWSTLARGVADRALDGAYARATGYLMMNLALGLLACWAGWHLAH